MRFRYALTILAFALALGCEASPPEYAETDVELGAGRSGPVQGDGIVTIQVRTQRDFYFKLLSAEPGKLNGGLFTRKHDEKGATGLFWLTVKDVPADAKIITLRYQYCGPATCFRDSIELPIHP